MSTLVTGATSGLRLEAVEYLVSRKDLPGHAAGHVGAFISTAAGWVLLASDAAWSSRSYQERVGPARITHAIMDDPAAYHRTLGSLYTLHRLGQVRVCLTHESDP